MIICQDCTESKGMKALLSKNFVSLLRSSEKSLKEFYSGARHTYICTANRQTYEQHLEWVKMMRMSSIIGNSNNVLPCLVEKGFKVVNRGTYNSTI